MGKTQTENTLKFEIDASFVHRCNWNDPWKKLSCGQFWTTWIKINKNKISTPWKYILKYDFFSDFLMAEMLRELVHTAWQSKAGVGWSFLSWSILLSLFLSSILIWILMPAKGTFILQKGIVVTKDLKLITAVSNSLGAAGGAAAQAHALEASMASPVLQCTFNVIHALICANTVVKIRDK